MANTLYLLTTTDEVDANSNVLDEKLHETTASYTEKSKGTLPLASSAAYTSIPYGGITTATYLRIKSTTALNVKLNAGSQVLAGVTDFIMAGTTTAATVSQSSGAAVSVDYEVYGA